MPLSGAERVRRFREKLLTQPQERLIYLQKDAQRKRLSRILRTPEQKACDQAETNKRVARFRERQKMDIAEVRRGSMKPSGPAIIRAYASARTLTRAVTKAKLGLPHSPKKAAAVVHEIAVAYGISPNCERASRDIATTTVATDGAVREFYVSDDISRQAPGRRDFVTLRTQEGSNMFRNVICL